ncbi:MAG TPA: sulfatase-like hydrolase/transferase [Allosphingosinicella sp.]|jgi:hypothetical protein
MELALPVSRWKERPAGLRSLENWLLCWLLLPNLGYGLFWIVGGPPRPIPIVITAIAGVLVHRAPFAIKFAAFVACMIFSALAFVSSLFNLTVLSLVFTFQFASELSPSASVEYVACGAAVVGTLLLAWWRLRKPTTLVQPTRFVAAMALTLIAASTDVAMAQGARGSYKRTPQAGAFFTSAVQESGLERIATGERHVVVIMVEAMGLPSDRALRRRLFDLWARPSVRARYSVTEGDSLFYGSTTNGEMRELCGRWAEYAEVMERRDPSCLPARLRARGYRTQATHTFNGTFFERNVWYPNIGFESMRFAPEVIRAGAERCPGVFVGACDRDVPKQLAAILKSARQPQFLYWLTVNSHLPLVESSALHTDECASFDAGLAAEFPMICRLMKLYDETGRSLAGEITADGFPDTDILIVGDHIPPFFDRYHREQFEPDSVPWILLRPRHAAGGADAKTAGRS